MSLKLFVCASVLLVCCIQVSIAGTNETDKQALLDIKALIKRDPLGVLSSWNDSLPVCNWYGVQCGLKHARVTLLDLNSSKLSGTISPSIGNLTFLSVLNLKNNSFGGTIPPEIGGLSRLQYLKLNNNSFGGTIPPELGRLYNLEYMSLSYNYLGGELPSNISRCSQLTELHVYQNTLVGQIPPELGSLQYLETLVLSINNFTGSIPSSISNSSNLVTLIMPHNKFQGQVPSLRGLNKLQNLELFDNKLGVGDPANDLEFIYSLANATNLVRFVVGNNKLSGTFPTAFCNFSMLSVLTIGENNLTGEIPSCIGNMANLASLDVRENNLVGVIPQSIGRLPYLNILYLGDNLLSGHIPSTIGNLTLLEKLVLYENYLQGNIPSALGNCGHLLALDLYSNNFSGRIPTEIFRLAKLSLTLDVSNNRLTGPLSDEVGGLVNLGVLYVSDNLLSGKIPTTLGACVELEELHMEGNFFQGVIPSTLTSLKSLQILDLSRNNLSGSIPDSLKDLPLKMLNLSYNNLEGEVPTSGVFSNATGVSTVGNSMLCGGLPQLKLNDCSFSANTRNRNHIKMALLYGISGFLLLVAVVSLYTAYHRKRTKSSTGASDLEKGLTNLSYKMLHRATNGFSSENLIGKGASGVVYKGTLEDVGTVIAVKIFNLKHRGASKSFVTECNALRNIRHKNLIKVITACSSLDYKGNDFKAIVYEYMANGSLDDWLHPTEEIHVDNSDTATRHLNLRQRLEIAVDVAFALEYLHHDYGSSVIHCDLKPSNVLLDEDMIAHVGDFGLVKFLSQAIVSSSHNQSSSIGVGGTIGYVPPEYGMGNGASMGGDVYSFGILVLELFTGKRPTDGSFKEESSLRDFVKAGLSEQDIRIADQALLQDMATEDSDSQLVFEVVTSVFEIALTCCTEVQHERPDISDIVAKLSSIQTKCYSEPNLSFQMLHRATNGFSSKNLIGSGASGVVYKGILEDVGTVIAVKIFNLEHCGVSKSFVAECKALRNIRHKNLIKVITACSSLDYERNDFKAIVYEYMANGSLDDWLHPTEEIHVDNSDTTSRHLNLRQRLEIAVDVAFALEYLHHDCGSSAIHCDLKPSNVLLDEDMMAHVGDFGLAKFLSQAIVSSSHNQSSSIGVRGTIGYAPPEYGMGNGASMGGDVYSFGILVLELFTGKRPTDGSFKEESSLRDFVKAGLSEQDIRIADQALLQDMATEDSDSQLVFEVVTSVFEIALTCCTEVQHERPDISDIVAKLSSIQTKCYSEPNLSFQMLHRATNGFSSKNLIGSGASGVVYKGILEDVGTVIAVKIFNLEHCGVSKSFVAECKALRNIRHRNLIKVITACSSLDYKGNDFKAIVYEYMANGSLDDWLHPTEEIHVDNSDTTSRHLNLRQRLEIAVDVAFALEYLHHDCGSSAIHCDLKPSNVLLDEDMMAHVGDFGLAKFLSQAIVSSSHNQSSSIGVRGTIGYAPPEYGMGNGASMGGDVYSFGIFVLEMFTGKRPTDGSFKEGRNLRDFVKAGLSEQDIRIADQALLQEMATEDSASQLVFEVVISVFEIALTCCTEVQHERPDISDIVAKLSSVRTKLQGLHMQQQSRSSGSG
ncbi:uncharacterized protein LOC141657537 isoform X2 [Silene latifolia]|uniref:uncharacterized protein LOC141657537 isoform X2 n=1 Tax=Silene latifolia TaxID=37657 RepID=UPI003D771B14